MRPLSILFSFKMEDLIPETNLLKRNEDDLNCSANVFQSSFISILCTILHRGVKKRLFKISVLFQIQLICRLIEKFKIVRNFGQL